MILFRIEKTFCFWRQTGKLNALFIYVFWDWNSLVKRCRLKICSSYHNLLSISWGAGSSNAIPDGFESYLVCFLCASCVFLVCLYCTFNTQETLKKHTRNTYYNSRTHTEYHRKPSRCFFEYKIKGGMGSWWGDYFQEKWFQKWIAGENRGYAEIFIDGWSILEASNGVVWLYGIKKKETVEWEVQMFPWIGF